jgi:RNA recognition motif-containing protein
MSTHGGPPRSRENWKIGCKVYVGNLSEGASKADIEGAFAKYGPLLNCWVARNPPGFAFVEFEDGRDAENACKHLDGTRIAGGRIKAEMSHGRTRRGRGGGPPSFGRGPPPYPYGGIGRGAYAGGPRGGHYNGHSDPYGAPRVGYGGHHGGYMDRPGRDRYPPPPGRSLGGKDYRHYSRSRSNSLGKSPPPPQPPQRATARPRTPPSRTPSPERH